MANMAELKIPGLVMYSAGPSISLEGIAVRAKADFKSIYEEHRHRIYSLAFWMTDNEITAEEISTRVFLRAFHSNDDLNAETIDRNLVYELRELTPIGPLTLKMQVSASGTVAGNTKRIHLERAVVGLPSTERLAFLLHDVEGYSHEQIAKTLGITVDESRHAVVAARVRVRESIASMIR